MDAKTMRNYFEMAHLLARLSARIDRDSADGLCMLRCLQDYCEINDKQLVENVRAQYYSPTYEIEEKTP